MTGRIFLLSLAVAVALACGDTSRPVEGDGPPTPASTVAISTPTPQPTPVIPDLQAELLDSRHKTTASPIGSFDFKNYTYELPRGWQNPDGTAEITLVNGRVTPVETNISKEMPDEEKAEVRLQRRIGLSYVTTKFLDVTSDGQDEAVVVLKIETGGAAIPQIVYIFEWKSGAPELIWPFRTGDRADGGLKDLRVENGEFIVELYGQDRFILGQTETGKITGDEEQLCCPTFFTRTSYRWDENAFRMGKKRLTYSVTDPSAPPQENLGDKVNVEKGKVKK